MLVGVFPGAGCCPGGRRLGGAWWLVLALCVAGVSGCSGGGGAGAEGPVMSGDYYVQSDGSLRRPGGVGEFPVPDPLVGEYSDAGAEAMASYYFETVAYAWNVGDPRAFMDMVVVSCQACEDTAVRIREAYADGGWAAKARASDFQVSTPAQVDDQQTYGDETYAVDVSFSERTPDVYANGTLTPGVERVRGARVLVGWDGYFWRVVEVEDQPQDGS